MRCYNIVISSKTHLLSFYLHSAVRNVDAKHVWLNKVLRRIISVEFNFSLFYDLYVKHGGALVLLRGQTWSELMTSLNYISQQPTSYSGDIGFVSRMRSCILKFLTVSSVF